MGELLEEQACRIDADMLAENKRRAQLSTFKEVGPAKLYIIEYLSGEEIKTFNCIAHGWRWQSRHKVFYLEDSACNQVDVAEFFCLPEQFIAQKCRRIWRE